MFCQIIAGKIPAVKVWEDDKYVAFLDAWPFRTGQTIVTPKRHVPSYAFGLTDSELTELVLTAKKIGLRLDKALGAVRTCVLFEGFGVDHVHAKLYPIMPGEEKEGLVPLGERADGKQLEDTAVKVRKGG